MLLSARPAPPSPPPYLPTRGVLRSPRCRPPAHPPAHAFPRATAAPRFPAPTPFPRSPRCPRYSYWNEPGFPASSACFIVHGGQNNEGNGLGTFDVLRVPSNLYWSQPPIVSSLAPQARFDHSLTAHFDGASAFLFGGTVSDSSSGSCAVTQSNEMWELKPGGFADAVPEEMVSIISSLSVPPVITLAPFAVRDPVISSADINVLVDGAALDGVANTAPTAAVASLNLAGVNRCFFTAIAGVTQPWIQIDLGKPTTFETVSLYAQTDCDAYTAVADQVECETRMQAVEVYSGNFIGPLDPWEAGTSNARCGASATGGFPLFSLVGGRGSITCSAALAAPGGHRYIWIVLPGVLRSIGLCEVAVLNPLRWAWRRYSGGPLVNVARGKPATQSSQASITDGPFADGNGNGQQLLPYADARNAVDGVHSNDARSGTCAVTDCDGAAPCVDVVPGAFQEWRVNLVSTHQVHYVKIWPAIFDGESGTGHGGPGVLPTRGLQWVVSAGLSPNPKLNTVCGGGPVDVNPGALEPDGSIMLPCVAQALFVSIRRYSGGADGSQLDGDDSVSVCEVEVYADLMINTPTARSGHAAAGFKGQVFIFGGAANGLLLNDMHMFSMTRRTWAPLIVPLGTPPAPRQFAQLTVLNAQRMAISGGVAGATPFSETFSNLYAGCPPVDTSFADTAKTICRQGGSACKYTCFGGAAANNNADRDGWLVCMPSGAYNGVNPPCNPGAAGPVTITNVVALSPTRAQVSWAAPSTGAGPITAYTVETDNAGGSSAWYDTFDEPISLKAPGYKWWDPSANATTGIIGVNSFYEGWGTLGLIAAPGQSCFLRAPGGQSGCPYMQVTDWPPDLLPTDFVVEAVVHLSDTSLAEPNVVAGVGIVGDAGGVLQWSVGVQYNAPYYYAVWQSYRGASPGAWRVSRRLTLPNQGASVLVWVRIERSRMTGNRFEAFYKTEALDNYLPMGRPATTADFFGLLQPYSDVNPAMRPAMIMHNFQSTAPRVPGANMYFSADFDFFRIGSPACVTQGRLALVNSTTLSAVVEGLTPGASYVFEVSASNDPNAGGSARWGPKVKSAPKTMPAQGPGIIPLSQLIEVGANRPAFMRPGATPGSTASLANDGVIASTLHNPTTGFFQCAATAVITPAMAAANPSMLEDLLTWTVDLGRDTDIEQVMIAVARDNNPANMDGFRVYLTDDASSEPDFKGFNKHETCTEYNQPYNFIAPSYNATFLCRATGRFLTVAVQAAVNIQLTVCEVQVWAVNQCPLRNSSANMKSVSPGCSSAKYKDQCVQQCADGYVAESGKASVMCNGQEWDGPELVCSKQCPALLAPPGVATCYQTIFDEPFTTSSYALVKQRWYPADRRQKWDQSWFYSCQRGGAGRTWCVLEAAARSGCLDDMLLLATHASSQRLANKFSFATVVRARDAAGLAFRVIDYRNYYRYVIDPSSKAASLFVVQAGSARLLASRYLEHLHEEDYYTLRAYVDGPSMSFTIARWDGSDADGAVVFEVSDNTFLSGGTGLYAETWANWQTATVWGACPAEADGCLPGNDYDRCLMVCRAGMNVGGSPNRQCLNSTWSGSPLSCGVQQPTFRVLSTQCYELQPIDSVCGDLLNAESFSPADSIIYAIAAGNLNNAFYIDSTTGALKVQNSSALEIELVPNGAFNIIVTALVVGAPPDTAINATVIVNLLRVSDPPSAPSPQSFQLAENSAPGAVVGNVTWNNAARGFPGQPGWEMNRVRWVLDDALDDRKRWFTVDPDYGTIRVARPASASVAPYNLNFEGVPSTFHLFLHAERVSDSSKTAPVEVIIALLDRDDPPTVDPNLVLYADQAGAGFLGLNNPLSLKLGDLRLGDEDKDTLSGFTQPPLAASFSYVPPSAYSGFPPFHPCRAADPAQYPTQNGGIFGADLFRVDSDGTVTPVASPSVPFSSDTPVSSFGELAVATFQLCVMSTDNFAGPGGAPSAYQLVPLVVRADLGSDLWLQSCSVNASAPLPLTTAGGTTITCLRGNSGISLTAPLTASYGTTTAPFYRFTTAPCTVVDSDTMTCVTVPGVGSNLVWSFRDGLGKGVGIKTPFVTSYAPPAVLSKNYTSLGGYVVGQAALPHTSGGEVLVITGTNFGDGSGALTPGTYSVHVTFAPVVPAFSRRPPQPPYVCQYVPPGPGSASDSTHVQCVMPAGAGTAMPLTITAGNTAVTTGSTVVYRQAVVTSIIHNGAGYNASFPGVSQLSPAGGETVILIGDNFGAGTRQSERVVATFGGTDGLLYSFVSCTHDAALPHQRLLCITPPAVGSNLRVLVTVAGQRGALTPVSLGISFIGPTITSIAGSGVLSGPTLGGGTIIIYGINFPPMSLDTSSPRSQIQLLYGPGVDARFAAKGCKVTAQLPSTPAITCQTSPGTGTMDSFILSVGGVASPTFVATSLGLRYQSPLITAVGGTAVLAGATSGGSTLTLTGQGFGPLDAYTNAPGRIVLWYGTTGTSEFGATTPAFRSDACRVTVAHTTIVCTTAPGVGNGLEVTLSVNGLSSKSNVISYQRPTITKIYGGGPYTEATLPAAMRALQVPVGDPNFPDTDGTSGCKPTCMFGSSWITLVGTGFGLPSVTAYNPVTRLPTANYTPIQPGFITFGETGVEHTARNFVHVSNTQIAIDISGGPGGGKPMFIRVKVANQVSTCCNNATTPTFRYAAPVVTAFAPRSGDTVSPDFNPTIVDLQVRNVPLLDPSGSLVVVFGRDGPMQQVLDVADLPTSTIGVFNLLNYDNSFNLSFALPLYYSGAYCPVALGYRRASGLEIVMPATPATVFSYNPPVISEIQFYRARPRVGLGGSPPAGWGENASCVACGITGYTADQTSINYAGPNPNEFCNPPCNSAQQQLYCPFPRAAAAPANNFSASNAQASIIVGAPNWNCSSDAIYKVVVLGNNFRTSSRELLPLYNPMPDGVTAFVELVDLAAVISQAGGVSVPWSQATYSGRWEPDVSPGNSVANGGSRTFNNYNAPGNPYYRSADASYVVSSNVFYYKSAWGNNRIELYTTLARALVRVRLVSWNPTLGACDQTTGLGPGCITQNSTFAYGEGSLSPTASALSCSSGGGADGTECYTQMPTAGGDTSKVLAFRVTDLDFAQTIEVVIGKAFNASDGTGMVQAQCRLCLVNGLGNFAAYVTDVYNQVIVPGLANAPFNGGYWPITCVAPAGQGSREPLVVTRVLQGSGVRDSTQPLYVGYMRPTVSVVRRAASTADFSVPGKYIDYPYGDPVAPNSVQAPTLGCRFRIIGANLGPRPQVWVGGSLTPLFTAGIPGTQLVPCANTTTHTCYEFPVPPGEGNGLNQTNPTDVPSGPPLFLPPFLGFHLSFYAGGPTDQGIDMPFSYDASSVSYIIASARADQLPTVGNASVNLTVVGSNFGAPNKGADPAKSNVIVQLGFAEDGESSWIACPKVLRINHTHLVCRGLPAGGGANLQARVTVANVVGAVSDTTFSYSPPLILEAYALTLQRRPADLPPAKCLVVDTKEPPPVGVNADNYCSVDPRRSCCSARNATTGKLLTLAACLATPAEDGSTSLPRIFFPRYVCNSTEFEGLNSAQDAVCTATTYCTGYGFDAASGELRNTSVDCSGQKPPAVATTILVGNDLADLRLTNFSDTISTVLKSPRVSYGLGSADGKTAYYKTRVTAIEGGKFKGSGWAPLPGVVLNANLTVETGFAAAADKPGPLTLRGPSRVVTENLLANSSATAPAVGSVLIILKGVNFGPGVFKGDPFSCAMLSWSARPDKAAPADPAHTLKCNNGEDFLGEGELANFHVLYWDDATGTVAFLAGEGLGVKDVEIVARRNSQRRLPDSDARRVHFQFDAPTLFWLEPRSLKCADGAVCRGLDTDGTIPVQLEYFGAPQSITPFRDCQTTTCYPKVSDKYFFFTPKPLDPKVTPTLPTATLHIVFYNTHGPYAVLTDAYTPDGTVHPNGNAACSGYDVDDPKRLDPKRSHCLNEPWKRGTPNLFVAGAPLGVGKNISVRLEVWDAGKFVSASAFLKTSYLPPTVAYTDPSIMYLDDGEMSAEQPRYLRFYGANFAKDEAVNGLAWSTALRLIAFTGSALNEAKAAAKNITCGGEAPH